MVKTKKKSKPSKLKTGLKVAGGALLAGGLAYGATKLLSKKKSATGMRGRGRKKSPAWYARQIMRLKLKKRYDKLRLSV